MIKGLSDYTGRIYLELRFSKTHTFLSNYDCLIFMH